MAVVDMDDDALQALPAVIDHYLQVVRRARG